jgi:sortase A
MLSRVPGRPLLVPAILLVVAASCAPAGPKAATGRSVSARPPVVTQPIPAPAPPAPVLPAPVGIPADPYASEPVVEIGTVQIPAIGLTHRLFQGVTLHNIDQGPSHWTGSALPGELGNAVIAGHRTTNDHPFRRIDELVPGDKVVFTVGGTQTTYRVTGHMIVGVADSWIADQSDAYTATLYACHPPGSTAERYVVRLEMQR